MSSNNNLEENFTVAKSSLVSFLVATLSFEYILAQNNNKNPKGYEFLMKIQEFARETVLTFGFPIAEDDILQMFDDFSRKVVLAIQDGSLPKPNKGTDQQ